MCSMSSPQQPNEDWAKVEYQQAQNSAQHHDSLVWQTTSILWGGNLVMLGLMIGSVYTQAVFAGGIDLHPLAIILSVLGILLSFFLLCMQWQFRSIRKQKYDRCKEIEAAYRPKQHTNVKYPKWIQPSTFGLVTAAFIAAWSWVIWEVVH